MYTVQLEKFSGPLDLLLQLIEDQKLDITEISLARVADQFLDYLKNSSSISPANLVSFLVVAARLILIKSKALLPILELTEEEEEDIRDLEQNLLEYKKFKEIARLLGENFDPKKFCFSRKFYEGVGFVPSDPEDYFPEGLTRDDLAAAFSRIVDEVPKFDRLPHEKIKDVVTLEEKIEQLKRSLADRLMMKFSVLAEQMESPMELIVTFLAVLEMIKQKTVVAEQAEIFGEITLSRKETAVPPENAAAQQ